MFGKSFKPNSLKSNSIENENEKSKFIFYSENEKEFSHQIELVINLSNFQNKRILIIVNEKNSIKNLKKKIISEFLNFPEFKNISNMKITNLKKKFEKENSIKIFDEKFDEEQIQNFFANGEILFCDLITDEMWLKINFKLISYDFNKNIKIDFKFNNNLLFSKMKQILIKSGINFFLDQIKINEKFNKNVFYLKNFKFKFIINNKIVYDLNLNNNEIIKNIFDINSEIFLVLNFLNFEEIVFNELKNIKIKEIYSNKIKFNEFKELNFEDFKNNNHFKNEINVIKVITQEIIKKNIFKKSSIMFFFYLNKNHKIENFNFNNNNNNFNNNNLIENDNNISKRTNSVINYFFNIIVIIPFVINVHKFINNSNFKYKHKKSFIFNRKFNMKQINNINNNDNNNFLKHKQNFLQINNVNNNSNSLTNDNNNLKEKLLNNNFQNEETLNNIENFHVEKNLDNLSEHHNNNIIMNNFTEVNSSFHIFEQNLSKFNLFKSFLKNNSNLYYELYKNFQYEKFYLNLKNKNKLNRFNKETFNNLEIPESKDLEILEKENEFLFEKPKKKFKYLKVNKYCIYAFIILVFIYFLIFIIAVNKEYFLI